MAATEPITQKQLDYINSLQRDRDVTVGLAEQLALASPLNALTRSKASAFIDALLACPPRRRAVAPADGGVVAVQATRNVPHGTYTVDMGDGSHVTLQFVKASFVKDRDVTAVAFLSGPDNELAYTGFAFVEQDGRVVVWRKFRDGYGRQQAALQLLLTGDVQEAHKRFLDQAEAYALRSGSCMRCGKTLTVPASLHRGLGPVCAGKEDATAAQIASTQRFEGEPTTSNPTCSRCGVVLDDDRRDVETGAWLDTCFNCVWAQHKNEHARLEIEQDQAAIENKAQCELPF